MSVMNESQKTENVKVFVRLRPLLPSEAPNNISLIDKEVIEVTKSTKNVKKFRFNQVFGKDASQLDVYHMVASPLVNKVLTGYNGTILAYGQSGTGKTHTILGDLDDINQRGLVPNILSHIFTQISQAQSTASYLVTVTFLEIYNEEVRDLLTSSNEKLEVREHPKIGVYVKNLTGEAVESTEQVFKIISRGSRRRVQGSTTLNDKSSRSHAIITLKIEAKQNGITSVGKLNLVDLAGSERISKSLASGDRLKEATKINLSLTVLGNVISALVDGSSNYIPYRNSKLTRLLQDSLGGNSLTSMIATISPGEEHFPESWFTLMYADRAKNIQNNVKKNIEQNSVLESFELKLKQLEVQLERIERQRKKKVSVKNLVTHMELAKIEHDKQQLVDKIDFLHKKILVGGENLLEKAEIQTHLLTYSSKQLELLDTSHNRLQEALESKQHETHTFARRSLSLQEEDKLLDFQIQEAEKEIAKATDHLLQKESEYQNEISNLLYINKNLAKDLGAANFVIHRYIPKDNLEQILENIVWDEDCQDYRLKSISFCGNNLKKINLEVGSGPKIRAPISNEYKKYPTKR